MVRQERPRFDEELTECVNNTIDFDRELVRHRFCHACHTADKQNAALVTVPWWRC